MMRTTLRQSLPDTSLSTLFESNHIFAYLATERARGRICFHRNINNEVHVYACCVEACPSFHRVHSKMSSPTTHVSTNGRLSATRSFAWNRLMLGNLGSSFNATSPRDPGVQPIIVLLTTLLLGVPSEMMHQPRAEAEWSNKE
jgi:hypothetical protein